MVIKMEESEGRDVGFRLVGKLVHEDYEYLIPELDRLIAKEGVVNMLILLEDFKGWELRAAWDDFKIGMKHYKDFGRIGVVGEEIWEEWMALFLKPFAKSEVKYFDRSGLVEAWKWLKEG